MLMKEPSSLLKDYTTAKMHRSPLTVNSTKFQTNSVSDISPSTVPSYKILMMMNSTHNTNKVSRNTNYDTSKSLPLTQQFVSSKTPNLYTNSFKNTQPV